MTESRDEPFAPARDQPGNGVALLIVDMVNPFDFPGADRLKPKALAAAEVILEMRAEADAAGIPVIYVNDNFGGWHSERSQLVESARGGLQLPELNPRDHDYFIIKPQFSGFYSTNLAVLLPKLGVRRLALTGIATDICILFTAADAHMRDYALWVPQDAVAAVADASHDAALTIMGEHMNATTTSARQMRLASWLIETYA